MGQTGRDLDFAQEPVGAEHRGHFGAKHLERDRPAVLQVLRQVDDGRAPAADLTLDGIAVAQRGLEPLEQVGSWSGHMMKLMPNQNAILPSSPATMSKTPMKLRSGSTAQSPPPSP